MPVRMLSHNFLLDRIVTVECQSNQSLVTSVGSTVGRGRNLRSVLSSERSECLSQKLLLLGVKGVIPEQFLEAVFEISVSVNLDLGGPDLLAFFKHFSESRLHDGELEGELSSIRVDHFSCK
jgi:hypothetical protein